MACREWTNAEKLLKGKQDDLDQARERAAAAKDKFDELQHLAEVHASYESSASEAAKSHTKNYEVGSADSASTTVG